MQAMLDLRSALQQPLHWDGTKFLLQGETIRTKPLVFNVQSYGALGDAPQNGSGTGTDDTAAFQSAITAWQNSTGGMLYIPKTKPDGTVAQYRVKGSLTFDAGSGLSYNQYVLEGNGAIIWADFNATHQTWWQFTNCQIRIQNLTIMGWNGAYPPSVPSFAPYRVVYFGGANVELRNVLFNGIRLDQSAPDNYGGCIVAQNSSIQIDNLRMGSTVNTSITPGINCFDWRTVVIRNSSLDDTLNWNNQSGSLGSGVTPQIVIGKPSVDTRATPISPGGHVLIKNVNLDEGSGAIVIGANLTATLSANFTVPVYPTSFPVVSGSTVNINVSDTSWMAVGDKIFIPVAGWYFVWQIVDSTHVRVWNTDSSNTGANGNATPGTVISSSGSPVIKGQGPLSFVAEDMDISHAGVGSPIFDLRNVMHTRISNTFARETGVLIKARYCNTILLENYETRYDDQSSVRTLDIDSTNDVAVLQDADVLTAGSTAKQTIVIKNGARSLPQYTSAGKPAASSVFPGTAIFDTTLKHLLISDGTTWNDVSVSGGANASQLQSVVIDTTTPTDQQLLRYISGTSKWTPSPDRVPTPPGGDLYLRTHSAGNTDWAALPGSSNPQVSAIDWLTQFVARGGTAPNVNVGGYTVGSWFFLASAGLISGARMYLLPGTGGTKTVKISLWVANSSANSYTRLESQNVVMSTVNQVYTVTWAGGGGAGGAWPVTGSDVYRRYAVTMWATDSSFYQAPVLGSGGISTKPNPPIAAAISVPLPLKPGLWLETWYTGTTAQADSAPEDANGTSTGNSALVEPVVII
jgi:hypothetical protein